jgi:hypothetical protein
MYKLFEHKHRFSAWAASRAASVIGCRFSVEIGQEILETIKDAPLPNNQKMFNEFHLTQRNTIISKAKSLELNFTHGVAAKILNCYYKSMYVNDESIDLKIRNVIHPPIDSLLLESLYKNEVGGVKEKWKKAKNTRWSKFSNIDYQEVIDEIIKIYSKEGLWKVEEYWSGYQ